MKIESFIEELIKFGYSVHEDIDAYVLTYTDKKKEHPLYNTLLEFNKSGHAYYFKFKKTNPKIIISGFADHDKQLKDKYKSFVNAVKLAMKPNPFKTFN